MHGRVTTAHQPKQEATQFYLLAIKSAESRHQWKLQGEYVSDADTYCMRPKEIMEYYRQLADSDKCIMVQRRVRKNVFELCVTVPPVTSVPD